MKPFLLAAILVCWMLSIHSRGASAHQIVATNRIGGASLDKWFNAANEWAKSRTFPEEIQRFSPEILPVLLDCFEDDLMNERLSSVPPEKRKEEVERLRISAMHCFMALGEKAASAIPSLARHLENRESSGRGILVNAVCNLGSASTNLVPLALLDLKAGSPTTRQQGVLLLYAAAKFSEPALSALLEATEDSVELVRHTAIYALFRNKDTSERAAARLEEIRRPASTHPDRGYVDAVFGLANESWVGGPRFR